GRAETPGEEVRNVKLGHRPTGGHRDESDAAADESDEEERLAQFETVREAAPEHEGRDRCDARRGGDDAHVDQVSAEGVRKEENEGGRGAAGDALRQVR